MIVKLPIYMDCHATTPVDPRVKEALLPYFDQAFGNAASKTHAFGMDAEKKVEEARAQVAHLIGASAEEIIFTGGATESNNLAIKGVWEVYKDQGKHIITQQTEHKSVLETCRFLEKQGAQVTYLPVDEEGRVRPSDVEKAVTPGTILISVMLANNEIGTLQPAAEIGKIAKARQVFFHADGAQAVGKIPVNVEALGLDLLSLTAHKVYGPKGAGALYARRKNPRVRLAPLIHGGEQEQGLRSGTLNVPGIVGLGAACGIAHNEMGSESRRVAALRDRLEAGLRRLPQTRVNGCAAARLAGNLNISFAGIDAEALLMKISREIAVSTSSACTSGRNEPSHVLKALAVPRQYVHGSVRFGLGRFTTEEEIDFVLEHVTKAVESLRALSPFYSAEGDTRMASSQ
ncbi:MAG TPA: IscS subfamily cysteine desulfurase [Verrucomicrobiae bacterium]|nr:IscS subfamily cysteine desulfurase [Verrucomicrobiae bacterium]